MKFLFVLVFVMFNYVSADEMQRIESIVKDISKLRGDYEVSQNELNACRAKLDEEKKRNEALTKEFNLYSSFTKNEIESLKNQLKEAKLSIKNKESKINNSDNEKSKNEENCLNNQIISDENQFPQLKMKDKYKDLEMEFFKATSFRLTKKSTIYDSVNGNKIDEWDGMSSFTSNQKTKDWIKITGYFINKKWTKADKALWVKMSDIKSRNKE